MMADSRKPSAEAYNASSVAGAKTHEGAQLPEPLWDDPDYVRREREWNRTAGDGWPHPEPLPDGWVRLPDGYAGPVSLVPLDGANSAPEQEVPHG
jgi:hypothetical protein